MLKSLARSSSVSARWHWFGRTLAAAWEDVGHVINKDEKITKRASAKKPEPGHHQLV